MNYVDKVITLLDDRRYIVIEQVVYNERYFVYLVNTLDEADSLFCEIDPEGTINEIDPELFEETIYPMFIEKFDKYEIEDE